MNLKEGFGRRLKAIRESQGMTQDRLAELADSTRDTIRNIESGKHAPRFGLFERIITALEVHPRDLFDFPWPQRKRR